MVTPRATSDNDARRDPGAPSGVGVLVLAVVIGAALFILTFGMIFNGLRLGLLVALTCYPLAGAFVGCLRGAGPDILAVALVAPAVPFVVPFFFGSIPEAGLSRALLWPLGLLLTFVLSLFGTRLGCRLRRSAV
jgi:hypothetical protein